MAKFLYLYHNKLQKLFNQYFKPENSVRNYNTRNASRKSYQLYSIYSNTAKKAQSFSGAQIGTTYTQNGWISLTTDLKKLSNATLLQIIVKFLYQPASSNLMRRLRRKEFFCLQ